MTDAPDDLVVEALAKNARTAETASLAQLREDRMAVVPNRQRPPAKYRLVWRLPMGTARQSRRSPGFIDSVLDAVGAFYGQVLQDLTAYVPPAPRIAKAAARAPDEGPGAALASDAAEEPEWRLSQASGDIEPV